ncbi:MAG TPA: SulP family inorganic anion transporter [Burkholderiaceae bacterium]|jgi:MFS superfamily sulfate permease-like transporter
MEPPVIAPVTATVTAAPRPWLADAVAGLSMAGLLLPEAVAYAGIAGLPPAAGLIGLLAGLACYAMVGRSRFAIVAATSSSAAVLGAATLSIAGPDAALRAALAAGLVMLTGAAFLLAALAHLGSISNFISKPVLRGFSFGLAVTIVIRQLATISGVPSASHDTLPLSWDLITHAMQGNLAGLIVGTLAFIALQVTRRWRKVPWALLVVACGIAATALFDLPARGVSVVGPIRLALVKPMLPALTQEQWMRLGELALALVLLLFAESYGAIRTMALKHGDAVAPNRDLAALGLSNLVSGLFQGSPVGAGYSATSANEAAGAASKWASLLAALVVLALVAAALPWIELTPQPVLAAVVVSALSHALSLEAFKPYFRWRRDRVVVLAAALAVIVLGVLNGLLIGIAASIAMAFRDFSSPRLSELGQLGDGHDFLNLAAHKEARAIPGLLIMRPEAALFFANVDSVLAQLLRRVEADRPRAVVLSLEETPDLDGTAIEAVQDFAARMTAQGIRLLIARVKDPVAAVLQAPSPQALSEQILVAGSVDDAVRRLALSA